MDAKPHPTANAKLTRDFEIRNILISHCGEKLTAENVDKISDEMIEAMANGPCAWAFKSP